MVRRGWHDDGMQVAIAVLRVFWGLVYLTNGLAKLVPGLGHVPGGFFLIDADGARRILEHEAAHHPVALYHDLVFNVLLPNWSLFGKVRVRDLSSMVTISSRSPWYSYA